MKKILFALVISLTMTMSYAKTYKVFIGTPAGSASDIQTRKLFDEVEKETGDNFIILNKPGAAFIVAYKAFIEESKTNPNVILFSTSGIMVNAYITSPNSGIDPNNEIKGLMLLQKLHYFLIVRNDFPYKSAKDIKGKVSIGTTTFSSDILVKNYLANVDYQIIPYKSENESTFAVLKGEIDMASSHNVNTVLIANQDKLRVIREYPENMVGVVGYSVIKDFPEDEKRKLNSVMNKIIKTKKYSSWMMETAGTEPIGGTGEKYDEILRNSFNEIIKLKDK